MDLIVNIVLPNLIVPAKEAVDRSVLEGLGDRVNKGASTWCDFVTPTSV